MIKHTLIATALIVGLAAPAFAADNGHHDRGNDAHRPQPASHQTYQRPTHTQPQYVATQRRYQQPRYQSNNGNG